MSVEIGPNIKAFIWDLDGTVINSFSIFQEIATELAPIFNRKVPDEKTFLDNYHGSLRDSLHNVLGGDMADERVDELTAAFLEKQHAYYETIDDHLIEDAINLSKRAQVAGIKQLIVTNRDHDGRGKASPRAIVASSVLNDSIHTVVCGDDGPYRKPDPRVLGNFLEREALQPENLLVLGDQFVDAQFAINLGSKAVVVSRETDDLVHAHMLEADWRTHVSVVKSLDEVKLV